MSGGDLELERLRRAFASLEHGEAATMPCPTPERLWSAVHGELPAEEVRLLAAHLVECPGCAEAWRLARLVDASDAVGSPGTARTPPQRRLWPRWAPLAAGTAAAALAASIWLLKQPAPAPEFREGRADEIRSLVPESDRLPRSRCRLRWSAGPEGATYHVQVATERLDPIAEARGLTATEYLVPPERLASLPPGTKLFWRVEAATPDGVRTASVTFVSRLE